jgi:hypothetical protein
MNSQEATKLTAFNYRSSHAHLNIGPGRPMNVSYTLVQQSFSSFLSHYRTGLRQILGAGHVRTLFVHL